MSYPMQPQLQPQLQPPQHPSHPSYLAHQQYNYPSPVLPPPSEKYPTANQFLNPGLFAEITDLTQRLTQTPPSLNQITALGFYSFLLQGIVEVKSPDGRTGPVSLFCIGIADPAAGKSSILKYYLSPFDDYFNAYNKQQEERTAKYQFEKKVWSKTEQRYINSLTKAIEREASAKNNEESSSKKTSKKTSLSAEAIRTLLEEHQQNKPTPPPPMPLAYQSDITPAAISKYIKENNTQSLGIFSPEAQEVIKNGLKNNSSIYNKGFSSEGTNKYRATRGDESHDIPITVVLLGQPMILDNAFGGDNNLLHGSGLAARCLFTYPTSNVGYRDYTNDTTNTDHQIQDDHDAQILEAHAALVKKWIAENSRRAMTGEPKVCLELSKDAKPYLMQLRQEIERQFGPGGRYADHHAHGSRFIELVLRIVGILHCVIYGLEGEFCSQHLSMQSTSSTASPPNTNASSAWFLRQRRMSSHSASIYRSCAVNISAFSQSVF